MAYEVSGTTPEGLVNPSPIDRTGGAIVLPDAELSPDKVLWYAVQHEDLNNKRNQQAARKALSDLNDIKISGWANHLTALNQLKNDVLDKASRYLQKYRGKTWEEFDPRNKQQAQEALDLQKNIGQLKEAEAFSEQIKTQAQQGEQALRKNPKGYTQESIDKWNDFLKQPIEKQQEYVAQNGSLPDFETQHNWRMEAIQAAKSVHDVATSTTTDANGVLHTVTNDAILNNTATPAWHSFITSEGGQQAINEVAKANPNLTGDQVLDKVRAENFDPVLGQYDAKNDRYVRKSAVSDRPDQVATSFAKEKAIVGEPVTVDNIITSPPTNKQGEAYIPLQYGGKSTYYNRFVPLTFKNDQQVKDFAGSIGELYKNVKSNQGNYQAASISSEEKSNFHPAGILSNSQSGEATLVMTAKNPKAVEPKNSDVTAVMTPEEKSDYNTWINSADDKDKADELYDKARQRAIDSGRLTKGTEDNIYFAPINAGLESKVNTIIGKPLREIFPERKNWTQDKTAQSTTKESITQLQGNEDLKTLVKGKLYTFNGKTGRWNGTNLVMEK